MNKIRSIAATLLVGLLICIVLTACENFLKGQEVKEQILDAIAYNNAPSCKVLLKADPAMGEFLSNGEQTFKVGYGSEIQFSVVKSAYCFTGFEAVSKLDQNVSLNEYVSFENPVNDDEKGIYKIKVKILKKSDDICIRPVCLEFPCVTDHTSSTAEYSCSYPISITFNVPMDPQEFSFATGNISIKNGMDDLTYAFSTPKFDKENKILTITPRGNDLYNYVSSKNAPFITVTIALSDKISIKKVSGQTEYTIPLKQDENSTFTVKYNPRKELELPEKYDFFASTTEISLQNVQTFNDTDGVNSNTKYSNIDLSDFTNSQALSNSTSGSVYIYGRYYDKDSGVASVVLTVKKTNDRKGIKVSEQAQTITFLKDNNDSWQIPSFNGNAVITDNGSFTEFVIKYDIPHDTTKQFNNDGAFYFTVEVSDACLNKAETMETFTAIKDTFVDMTNVDVSNSSWSVSSDPLSDDDIYSKLKYIKIENANKNIYSNFNESLNNFTVSYTSNGIKKTGTMLGSGSSKWYTLEIDNNEISDLKITITATDKLGNQGSKDFYFPPKPTLSGNFAVIQPGLEHVTSYRYMSLNNPSDAACYLDYEDSNMSNRLYSYTGVEDRLSYQNGNLRGDFITLPSNFYSGYTKATNITLPNVKLEYKKLEGSTIYYDISVGDENYQNDFDYIYILLYANSYTNKNTTALHCISKGSRKISVSSHYASSFYNYPVYLTVWATKDNYYYTNKSSETNPIFNYTYRENYNNYTQTQKTIPAIKDTPEGQGQLSTAQPVLDTLVHNQVNMNYITYPNAFDYFCCSFLNSSDPANNLTSMIKTMIININDIEYVYDNSIFSYTNDDKTKSKFYIPVWDFDTKEDSISFKQTVISYSGKSSFQSLTLDNYSIDKTNQYHSPAIKISRTNDTTLKVETIEPVMYKTYTPTIYIGKYVENNGKYEWQQDEYSNKDLGNPQKKDDGWYFSKDLTFNKTNGMFLKVSSDKSSETSPLYFGPYNYSPALIFYTGKPGTGNYDLLMRNGQSKESVAIQSDAPVFVQTLVTKKPYEQCKNWTSQEWEYLHRHIGEQYFDFSDTARSSRRYSIPVSQIDSGDCYVVIAHYADNHIEMSEVMQK